MKPKITAIGSCRVFTPIDLVARLGCVEVGHSNFSWFTHSAADAVQKMRIVEGECSVPPGFLPLIINEMRKFKPEFHFPGALADTDVFVVEVCSAQQYWHSGFALQQWRVRDALTGVIFDPVAVQIAQTAERRLLKAADIIADIEQIKQMVGTRPVLLVSHNMLSRPDGRVPSSRLLLREAIEKAAKLCSFGYFDPTEDILDFGVERAMKDLAHYTPIFEKHIGERIVAHAKGLAS